MITLIDASNGIFDYSELRQAVRQCPFEPTVLVSCGSVRPIVDLLAQETGLNHQKFYGNREIIDKMMLDKCETMIALWAGKDDRVSRLILDAKNAGLYVFTRIVK